MTSPLPPSLSVLELRQYTLHPGRRDELIALFEREFVESQAAVGSHVLASCRDLDDPDRFVWIRGFADMAARAPALQAFYGGPVWQAHRDAANATMVDSDDVRLLRPLPGAPRLESALQPRRAVAEAPVDGGVFTLTVCPLRRPADAAVVEAFDQALQEGWLSRGGDLVACWASETAANDFPRLPVREDEPVIAWLARFDDEAAQRRQAALLQSSGGLDRPEWRAHLSGAIRHRRLAPTHRSALRRLTPQETLHHEPL